MKISKELLILNKIYDIHGNKINNLFKYDTEGILVFIDLNPNANWSHPCSYIFIDKQGNIEQVYHDWPPSNDIKFNEL